MLWWFSLFCVNTDFYNRIRKRFSMPWYMYISCSLLQPKHRDICVNIEFMIHSQELLSAKWKPTSKFCWAANTSLSNLFWMLSILNSRRIPKKNEKKKYKKLPLFFQYNFLKACLFEYWYMWLLKACHSYVNVAHTIIFLIYRAWSGILWYYS